MSIILEFTSGAQVPGGASTAMALASGSPNVGDCLIAVFTAPLGGLSVTSAPTGWVHIPNDSAGKQVGWYKIAIGGEASSYSFSFNQPSPAGHEITGLYMRWSGTDPVAPISSTATYADSGGIISSNAHGQITTARNNSVALFSVLVTDGTFISTPPPVNVFFGAGYWDIGEMAMPVAGDTGAQKFHLSGTGGSAFGKAAGLSIALQPPSSPPNQPTLQLPASGAYVDLAAGSTFSWLFSDPDVGDTQFAYAFRRKTGVGGSYEYWIASGGGSWSPTLVYNNSSAPNVTFPAGVWNDGATYLWSVANKDQTGLAGGFAADRPVVASAPPTLTVTAPTGTVTTTTRPSVTWLFADADADVQAQWRGKVFTDAQHAAGGFDPEATVPLLDSGLVPNSAASWSLPDSLANSTTYWAFVKAFQVGGQNTGWQSSSFTISVTPPADPSSVVVAPDVTLARNLVTVHGPTSTTHEIQRSTDGATWAPVRNASALVPNGSGISSAYDYEAPLNVAVTYRARAGALDITSAWVSSSPSTLAVGDWWMKNPFDPSGNTAVDVPGPFSAQRDEPAGVFTGLGSQYPVVVSDTIRAASGALTVEIVDLAVHDALVALRNLQSTILLQSPFLGDQWYIRATALSDPLQYADGTALFWQVSLDWVEVAQP